MLKRWLQQLGDAMASSGAGNATSQEDRAHALRLATAALMVDVARADHEFDEAELKVMLELMSVRFDLTAEETRALADDAGSASSDAVSAYEFT